MAVCPDSSFFIQSQYLSVKVGGEIFDVHCSKDWIEITEKKNIIFFITFFFQRDTKLTQNILGLQQVWD
jgi:hypothetical protein